MRKNILKTSASMERKDLDFIFQTFKHGYPFFCSLLANKFLNEFKRPVILISFNKKIRGSIRTLEHINAVDCLKYCKDFLNSFGGHPVAAGFEVKKGRLKGFEKCVEKFFLNI